MPIPTPGFPIGGPGFPHGESAVRLRPTPVLDPYSGEMTGKSWDDPDLLDIEGWGVDDSRSLEPIETARNAIVTDFVLYRPNAADVLAGDRIEVRGQLCEVVGNPAFWRNPLTGWNAGFVVRANVVEG